MREVLSTTSTAANARSFPDGREEPALQTMPDPDQPRALMVAFFRIGDLTVATPLLRALARGRRLSLLTRPFGAPLLGEQSYIDRVWTLDYPNRGARGIGKALLGGHRRALGRRLVAAGFDEVFIYETERDIIRDWLRECFPGRVREIARRAPGGTHVGELCGIGAASVGCDMHAYRPVPELEIDAPQEERARQRLADIGERVVGIQMGSQRTDAGRRRRRPNLKSPATTQWSALVTRLIREDQADAIVVHGSAGERAMVRRFIAGLDAPVRARCHDLTDVELDLLPAVLAVSRALISVDTGTAHIAAAVRCPSLVLFGPTDPAVFAPRGEGPIELLCGDAPCQFCHGTPLYKRCRDNICLNRLDDATLWEAWVRLCHRMRDTVAGTDP